MNQIKKGNEAAFLWEAVISEGQSGEASRRKRPFRRDQTNGDMYAKRGPGWRHNQDKDPAAETARRPRVWAPKFPRFRVLEVLDRRAPFAGLARAGLTLRFARPRRLRARRPEVLRFRGAPATG